MTIDNYNYLKDKMTKFDIMVSCYLSGFCPDIAEKYQKELGSIDDGKFLTFLYLHDARHSKLIRECKLCYSFMPYESWIEEQTS